MVLQAKILMEINYHIPGNRLQDHAVKLDDSNTAVATFTAPSTIDKDTDLTFSLIVADINNTTNTSNVKVTVKYSPPTNKSPTANAGSDQTINSGETVTLDSSDSK